MSNDFSIERALKESFWMPSPPALRLSAETAHVWRVSLLGAGKDWAADISLLSVDERERAFRFRRPRDARLYAYTRTTLRRLLGRLTDTAPGALRFAYGAQGKPALAAGVSPFPLAFNVSHSGDFALIAVCAGDSVGVDIERVRADFSGDDIARRFFCAEEIAWLHGLPDEQRAEGFFRLWTRKEAFLKARGEGIWHDLSRFDVSQSPPGAVRASGEASEWCLHDLEPAAGYRAALAVQADISSVLTWEWTP